MDRILFVGIFKFKENLKQKSTLYFLLFSLFVFVCGIVRQLGVNKNASGTFLMFVVLCNIYINFVAAYMFANEFSNGMYKQLATSNMNSFSFIIGRTLSVVMTSAFMGFIAIGCYAVWTIVGKEKVNVSDMTGTFIFFIILAFYISQVSYLLSELFLNYKSTVIFVALYTLVFPYAYVMVKSLWKSVDLIEKMPIWRLRARVRNADIRVADVTVILGISLVYMLLGWIIEQKSDFSRVNGDQQDE